ncbi:MAG: galactonate dehydratase [Candidatus Omnitrophica bacterium]|nr:galactonate dehydratase [Candidatus Omnitrophota bacterium]
MKIAKIDAFPVYPRSVFVRIETDSGIIGWGEPSLEGHAETQVIAVNELARYLIGKNPFEIERHWQAMYRGDFYKGGPVLTSAISGVDQALWDILGKALEQPVHQLLGGRARDKIKVYTGIGGSDDKQIADSVQRAREQGYRAGKWCPVDETEILDGMDVINKVYNRVAAARNAASDDFDILLDFHGRLAPAMAISVIDAITELRPFFVEEPIPPENVDAMVKVARAVKVPIATGERLFTKFDFRALLEKQAVAIVQPDLCHAGGITEVKKIASMAEAYYVGVCPHNPLHGLSTAACLQIDACSPNFVIQERGSLGEDLFKDPIRVVDGFVEIPTRPGMGFEVDEDKLKVLREKWEDWATPRLWHEDGSVADW